MKTLGAERRALKAGSDKTTVRLSDLWELFLLLPEREVELVYEGEQERELHLLQNLIGSAIHTFSQVIFQNRS
jgi:hypothetical protein